MSARSQFVPVMPRSGRIAQSRLCQYFHLCMQPTGDLRDMMGGPPAIRPGNGFLDSAAWANPGFVTTLSGGTLDRYFSRPALSGHDFTLAGRALIFSAWVKKATPGSNEIIAGGFTSGTVFGGIQMTANSTGSVGLAISTVGGTTLTLTIANTYTPLDGQPHMLTWVVPPDPVSARMYKDMTPASSASAATIAGQSCAGGNILNFGAARAGTARDAQFASIQQYSVPAATLSSIDYEAAVRFMFMNPHLPVPDWFWRI